MAFMTALLNLYDFGVSGARHCLRALKPKLQSVDLVDLEADVDSALVTCDEARAMEKAWKRSKDPSLFGMEAMQHSHELNRSLTALHDFLDSAQRGYGPTSPKGEAAGKARKLLFDQGVLAISSLRFPEREDRVAELLALTQSNRTLSEWLQLAGATDVVASLVQAHERFGEGLRETRPPTPTFTALTAARKAAQEGFSEVVIHVASALRRQPEGTPEARQLSECLELVMARNAAIRSWRKRRRRLGATDAELEREFEEAADEASDEQPVEATESPEVAQPGEAPTIVFPNTEEAA